MKEIVICPNCNQQQTVNKLNYCSFCYTVFSENSGSEASITEEKPVKKTDNANKKKKVNNFIFIGTAVIFVAVIIFLALMQNFTGRLIPSEQFRIIFVSIPFALAGSVAVGYFYFHKRQLNLPFKSSALIFLSSGMLAGALIVTVNALFDFSKPAVHKVFIISKGYTSNSKGGSTHYIRVTSWHKNSNASERINIDRKTWNNLKADSQHIIKTKKGALGFERIISIY